MAFRCVLALFWGVIAVVARADNSCSAPSNRPPPSGEFAPLGLNVRTLSGTVKPGDDFFGYINEGWIAATPIPAGYWDYGQTNVLGAIVDGQVRQLIEESLAARAPRGNTQQVVGDAYASFLDTAEIERRGYSRIRAELGRIVASRTPEAIARWMANPSSSSIIAINVYPAERRWRVHLDQQNLTQPMLGLPYPEAYSRSDAEAASAREAYRAYVAELLGKAGVGDARHRAARVLALETQIAANLWPFEKLRDRRANYHPMTVRQLVEYAPGFPWRTFLEARGVGRVADIVLGTDTAVRRQAALFASTSVDDWASYLAFHWLRNQIDVLPQELRRVHQEFSKSRPAREDLATRLVNSSLGLAVGQLYAGRFVTQQTKSSAEEMLSYLRRALAERLRNAAWMDEGTRSEALTKLDRIGFKVGNPKIPRDYSIVRIRRDDAAGNLQNLREADWVYQRGRLIHGNHEMWNQTPQTVDASYSVLLNAIELPGAFLQPPYFDTNADAAVNFGAIGAILGHEMGHAFDDQGIIYDSDGRMRNWWSASSLEEFHRRTRALVDQYDAFAPYPDAHVNGQRTIGENIADLSGVLLAFRAYHLYLADHPCVENASLDGLTGDQRFFAAWAQAWRYKAPESAVRHVLRYSYYAPTPFRVNGVMRNIDEWYEAFDVSAADKLYLAPEKRVRLW